MLVHMDNAYLESILLKNIAEWEIWNELDDQADADRPHFSSKGISISTEKRNGFEDIEMDAIIASPCMQRIDTSQGFSNGFLLSINTVCDLTSNTSPSDPKAEKEITSKIKRIESYLLSLKQLPPDIKCSNFDDLPLKEGLRSVKEDIMNRKKQSIVATAEANRLGALLFLEIQMAAKFPQINLESRSTTYDHMQKILILAEEVSEKDIVTQSRSVLAGCFSDEENRPHVLSVLYKF